MKHKVLVETSVLVAASVYSAKRGFVETRHQFFDRSMLLFGLLKTHRSKEIGLTTEGVEREASRVLERAVIQELGADVDPTVKSVTLNLCWDRFAELLSVLVKEAVDQTKVDQKFIEVVGMYKELLDRASLVTATTARGAAVANRIVPARLRNLCIDIYTRQLLQDRSQLTRLRYKRPSITDQFILAETACLYDEFSNMEDTTMFLASTDKALSPELRRDGSILSDYVTREIARRFSVHCDWPERIAAQLRQTYH